MKRVNVSAKRALGVLVLSMDLLSGWAQEAATPTVPADGVGQLRLEPMSTPTTAGVDDFRGMRTLSNGAKVYHLVLRGYPNNNNLLLVNPDGTNRRIPTNGTVKRIDVTGENVYTYELILTPSVPEELALQAALAAAGQKNAVINTTSTVEIREYNLAAGTSRTLRSYLSWRRTPSGFEHWNLPYEFQVEGGRLYLFGSEYDEVGRTYDIQITAVSLDDLSATSTVIPETSSPSGPGNFIIRDGWLYCLAKHPAGHVTNPRIPAKVREAFVLEHRAVTRMHLATGERQILAAGGEIMSFDILDTPKALVYARREKPPDRPRAIWILRLVGLDQSAVMASHPAPPNAVGVWLSYDEATQTMILGTGEKDPAIRDALHQYRLYQVSFSQ